MDYWKHQDAILERLNQFRERIKKSRKALGLTQAELGHELGYNQTTISHWEADRDVSSNLPTIYDLLRIQDLDSDHGPAILSHLLEALQEQFWHEHQGVQWTEYIPSNISDDQLVHINMGMDVFHALFEMNQDRQILDGGKYKQYGSLSSLYTAFNLALMTGCLRITDVRRNKELEKSVLDWANQRGYRLKDILVVDVPENNDGTPIRSELVAVLACEIFSRFSHEPQFVGIGSGYTLTRLCSHSIFQKLLHTTMWVPLMGMRSPSFYSANYNCQYMASLHQGRKALVFPHQPTKPIRLDHEFNEALNHMSLALVTVNSHGPRKRNPGPNPVIELRGDNFTDVDALANIFELVKRKKLASQLAGEMLGVLLNDDGQPLDDDNHEISSSLENEYSQVELDVLRRVCNIGEVWCIAAMDYKTRAIHMALKSGYVNCLAIDSVIANTLTKS